MKNHDQQRPLSKKLAWSLKENFIIKSTYTPMRLKDMISFYETKAVFEYGIVIAGKSMREQLGYLMKSFKGN